MKLSRKSASKRAKRVAGLSHWARSLIAGWGIAGSVVSPEGGEGEGLPEGRPESAGIGNAEGDGAKSLEKVEIMTEIIFQVTVTAQLRPAIKRR